MVPLGVEPQRCARAVGDATLLAHVLPAGAVRALVSAQALLAAEPLSADAALVARLLPRAGAVCRLSGARLRVVGALVAQQTGAAEEARAALGAQVRPRAAVLVPVTGQLVREEERRRAQGAAVAAVARVPPQVGGEVARLGEGARAQAARERTLA